MIKRRNIILATLVLMCGLMLTAATPAHAAKKKSVYVLSEVKTVDNTRSSRVRKYTYNKNGILAKRVSDAETFNYQYKGKKWTKLTGTAELGSTVVSIKNTYNKKGLRTKFVEYRDSMKFVVKFSYDKKNRLKKKTISGDYGDGKYKEITKYTYDSKGRVKKETVTYDDTDDKYVTTYKYDKHGMPTKETWSRYKNGEKLASDVTTYENLYDDGRLISRTMKNCDAGVYSYTNVELFSYKKIKVSKKYVKAVKKQQKILIPNGYMDIDT